MYETLVSRWHSPAHARIGKVHFCEGSHPALLRGNCPRTHHHQSSSNKRAAAGRATSFGLCGCFASPVAPTCAAAGLAGAALFGAGSSSAAACSLLTVVAGGSVASFCSSSTGGAFSTGGFFNTGALALALAAAPFATDLPGAARGGADEGAWRKEWARSFDSNPSQTPSCILRRITRMHSEFTSARLSFGSTACASCTDNWCAPSAELKRSLSSSGCTSNSTESANAPSTSTTIVRFCSFWRQSYANSLPASPIAFPSASRTACAGSASHPASGDKSSPIFGGSETGGTDTGGTDTGAGAFGGGATAFAGTTEGVAVGAGVALLGVEAGVGVGVASLGAGGGAEGGMSSRVAIAARLASAVRSATARRASSSSSAWRIAVAAADPAAATAASSSSLRLASASASLAAASSN
mmetsp:Transcript_28802/g.66092  ORF Transcript_28802/g.66092 Transcript_28802/m.66092 type:complete len:412 (-) Transcript_28802:443-1678(-)